MRVRTAACALLAAALTSCTSPAAIESEALAGSWSSGRVPIQPSGSYEIVLSFSANGGFLHRVTTYGLYPQTAATERSSDSYTKGAYEVTGDHLRLIPDTHVWWDAGHTDPGPHRGEAPSSLYDDCTFALVGGTLELRYTTYPADGPVETVATYHRY